MKRRVLLSWLGSLGSATLLSLGAAPRRNLGTPQRNLGTPQPDDATSLPVPLPAGFRPAGIALGRAGIAYVGSCGNGAIYQVALATGQGRLLVAPQREQTVLGLAYDPRTNYLVAAGANSGNALVFDVTSGALVHELRLTTNPASSVQDVAITGAALFFTDVGRPVLYRVPLARGGVLAEPGAVEELPLGGDFTFVPDDLNGSGIVATPDGRALLIGHTALGTLYRVEPATGSAAQIDLGGAVLRDSSALALAEGTLYVVNFNQRIDVVELDMAFTRGRVQRTLTSRHFDNPSAAIVVGDELYVVSARVTTDALPETEYWLARVAR